MIASIAASPIKNDRHATKPLVDVLFVAPTHSRELNTIRTIWNYYAPEFFRATFSTLEYPDPSIGYHSIQGSVETPLNTFDLSLANSTFHSVIAIGCFHTYVTLSPLLETLKLLFGSKTDYLTWTLENSESDPCSEYAEKMAASKQVEAEIIQLIATIQNRQRF